MVRAFSYLVHIASSVLRPWPNRRQEGLVSNDGGTSDDEEVTDDRSRPSLFGPASASLWHKSSAGSAIVDVNGGLSGSGKLGSVFILDGTGFGDLAAQTSGYSLDFRDATSNAVVASATSTVNYAGGAWKSLFITATVPATGSPPAPPTR